MGLDQQIIELKAAVASKDMYERKLSEALSDYQEALKKEKELAEILKKEKKDVERLEHLSLFKIWCSMFGSKEEKLEKEKAELSRAEYNYRIIKTTITDLEEDIEQLRCKLETIHNNEVFLEKLLKEKEKDIIASNSEEGLKIIRLNEEIANKQAALKELDEAITAGKDLTAGLRNTLVNLEKASRLGTWDVLGGGLLVDIMKHNHIDSAKRNLEDLKYLVDKFARELKDVNFTFDIKIEIGGLLSFSDWFFDGFFVDMFMKSRIDQTRSKIEKQLGLVEDALANLSKKHEDCLKELSKITEEKRNLLL